MKQFSIAFYNVENFYAKNEVNSLEESFIVGNKSKWNNERYALKLNQICTTLSHLGKQETGESPAFIGLAEIENSVVLEDIVSHPEMFSEGYDYVVYNSLDERNINVALLYKKDEVEILQQKPIRVVFKNALGIRSYTRDILWVKVKYQEEVLHLFVLHLPSKRDGLLNHHKRSNILQVLKNQLEEIHQKENRPNIVLMGDFNDTPTNQGLIDILSTKANYKEVEETDLFNPFVKMMSYQTGTIIYKKQWLIFDQMLFSKNFFVKDSLFNWKNSKIFNPNNLFNNEVNDLTYPFRTFKGNNYFGGPSDHFPIFSIINYNFADRND